MLKPIFHRKAQKFLLKLPKKHKTQIASKIQLLLENPLQNDVKQLRGKSASFLRADSGEYRIIFRVESDFLYIDLIGKRNDNEIYKMLENFLN